MYKIRLPGKKVCFFISILFLFMIISPGCVSKRKYIVLLKDYTRLQTDSTDLSGRIAGLRKDTAMYVAKISNLQADSTRRIAYFDTTVNKLIEGANTQLDTINRQYDRLVGKQTVTAYNQLAISMKYIFSALSLQNAVEIKNQNGTVKITLLGDSLYNKDSLNFNTKGNNLLSILNSGELKKVVQGFYLNASNLITYKTPAGKTYSVSTPSIIFDQFIDAGKSLNIYPDYTQQVFPNEEDAYINQKIEVTFYKEYHSLSINRLFLKAVKGTLIQSYMETNDALANMAGSYTRDISITYPVLSDKYLFYPSDYDYLKLATVTNKRLLQVINKFEDKYPRLIKVVRGNSKQTINCDSSMGIIIVANNKILQRYSPMRIDCNVGILKLQ